MLDEDGSDYDDLPTGTGYDDGVPTTSTPSPSEHRAPQTWAAVEAMALVSADSVLEEHVEGELARAEREREGADSPPPRRRGIFQ